MQDITSHGFESHSRRPADCRVCKMPAGRHATCTDAYQGLWKSLRNPLVTPRIEGYSTRTLGVLMAVATLGGKVDAWDRSSRGWHKTAVAILDKDGLMVQVNPGELPERYELTETGVQACRWHGIEITQIVEVTPVTSTTAESLALLEAIAEGTANPWGPCGPCDGTEAPMARKAHPCGLMPAEVTEGTALVDGPWRAMERDIWGGTEAIVRTRPRSFRKVKNTRSSRARRGGA